MRVALVTGASSGIGAACARRLADAGWRVLAGVRRPGSAPPGTEEILLDVTSEERIGAAAAGVDRLDGLVNGIVFVGSIAGRSALPFLGAYAASKHALEAIADTLRVELRPFGIEVSIVEPGTIRTEIWTRAAALARSIAEDAPAELGELYGGRIAAFRRVALRRGANGAPAAAVARAVEDALTSRRPPARRLVGRDARVRSALERRPDRMRDRAYEQLLLHEKEGRWTA